MRQDLTGKIAVVTGAAQGIGKAIAEKLAGSGATVVISDILAEKGIATAAEIGERASFIPCDVSALEQVRSLVDAVTERFGRLDVMVNNAGINSTRSEDRVNVADYPIETWNKIINVDLTGTFYCCKTAASQMIRQGSGCIINIASVAGVVALRLQIAFVAAKAGVIRMTESMACELASHGIRVNAVSPGSTLTEATQKLFYGEDGAFKDQAGKLMACIPQNRPGDASEIADAAVFLSSDAASYITGHNIVVDGGWTAGFSRDF